VGSARIGERRILELGEEFGWDALEQYAREWFDYSEAAMASAIHQLPAGRVTSTTAHDPFAEIPGGISLSVSIEVKPADGRVVVDLTQNPDCLPCGMNLSESTSRNAALIGVFNSLGREVPANEGSFRRVDVMLRENCVVGIPRHPASCSIPGLADRLINAIQRSFAELGDGFGLAEGGLIMPPTLGVISGTDPVTNESFIDQLILPSFTGGPGAPEADGWLMVGAVVTGGMMLRDSVEIDELRHPIRIWRQSIIPDSEGAGRYRGAPGAYCEFGPVGTSIDVMYASDGNELPAQGARGGGAGACARQFISRSSGKLEEVRSEGVHLQDGETIVSYSCGGGGYGEPRERDRVRVRIDVVEGWITPERARAAYGVDVGDETTEGVMSAALAASRARLAGMRRLGESE
jgi:N-methylhydantoinase B